MPATPQVMANIDKYGQTKPPVGLPPAPIEPHHFITPSMRGVTAANRTAAANNSYYIPGEIAAATVPKDYLRAIAMIAIFGQGTEFAPKNHTDFDRITVRSKLPFSLNNLNSDSGKNFVELTYNTQSQGVNEYSDKPYPLKGQLVVVEDSTGAAPKDLDNYVKWAIYKNTSGTAAKSFIYVGILNSSQTDYYTPLSGLNAVFYEIPNNETVW